MSHEFGSSIHYSYHGLARLTLAMPGLALPENTDLVCRNEAHARRARQFNIILTGAAFMDASSLFPLVMAPALAPLRTLVDDLLNCEDLLVNFVAANASIAGQPYAQVWPAPKLLVRSPQAAAASCAGQ